MLSPVLSCACASSRTCCTRSWILRVRCHVTFRISQPSTFNSDDRARDCGSHHLHYVRLSTESVYAVTAATDLLATLGLRPVRLPRPRRPRREVPACRRRLDHPSRRAPTNPNVNRPLSRDTGTTFRRISRCRSGGRVGLTRVAAWSPRRFGKRVGCEFKLH